MVNLIEWVQDEETEEDKEWIQVPSAAEIRAAQEEEQRHLAAAQAAEARSKMVECPICNQVRKPPEKSTNL